MFQRGWNHQLVLHVWNLVAKSGCHLANSEGFFPSRKKGGFFEFLQGRCVEDGSEPNLQDLFDVSTRNSAAALQSRESNDFYVKFGKSLVEPQTHEVKIGDMIPELTRFWNSKTSLKKILWWDPPMEGWKKLYYGGRDVFGSSKWRHFYRGTDGGCIQRRSSMENGAVLGTIFKASEVYVFSRFLWGSSARLGPDAKKNGVSHCLKPCIQFNSETDTFDVHLFSENFRWWFVFTRI